jgi:hypothetical protein
MFIPGGLNFLRLSFAHDSATLQDRGQGVYQLHRWSGGLASARLLLGFFLPQGASAFRGLTAGQSLGYSSPLGFGRALGRRWSGRGMSGCGGYLRYTSVCSYRRFSVSSGRTEFCFQQKVVKYSPVLEDFARKIVLGRRRGRSHPTAPA